MKRKKSEPKRFGFWWGKVDSKTSHAIIADYFIAIIAEKSSFSDFSVLFDAIKSR